MSFNAKSITCVYDLRQDRLNLQFNDANQAQMIGHMTRQFLKELLTQLPDWLMQQQAAHGMPQSVEQQRAIHAFRHQMSQQHIPVSYEKKIVDRQIESFLIHSITLTKNKPASENNHQRIKLEFLDGTQTIKTAIVFTIEQLHKLIGEILKQVRNWDLIDPWSIDNDRLLAAANAKNDLMH